MGSKDFDNYLNRFQEVHRRSDLAQVKANF